MPPKDRDYCEPSILRFPSPLTDSRSVGLPSDSCERRWFLVHTKPRQERVALVNLERQSYESYLPLFAVQKIVRKELAVAQEPMFARYLFVRIAPDCLGHSWMQIRSTIGVSKVVRFGEQPAWVENAMVEGIRQRESMQNTSPRPLFASGDKVIITDGSLAGLEAIYHAQDAEGRAAVLLEILSRRVTLKLDSCSLRKVK
jgi:transcriptional antiterminator RfaH